MITIFTTCMPTSSRKGVDIMQVNAIGSWASIRPKPQIIILGNDEGAKKLAKRFNCDFVPTVARNKQGTPLMSSMFALAREYAKYSILCWTNSDIIYHKDLVNAATRCHDQFDRFAMTGSRWREWRNWYPLNFRVNWRKGLRLGSKLTAAAPVCLDYFCYEKTMFIEEPPPDLAAGRYYVNAWFFRWAWMRDIPLVDATDVVMPIHHFHKPRNRRSSEAMANKRVVKAACNGEEPWWNYFPVAGKSGRAAPEKFWHLHRGWKFKPPKEKKEDF